MAPRARHAKSKARLDRYEALLADSGPDARGETQELFIPPGPRLGDVVVRAEGVRKAYGDRLLMEDLSFDLPRGGIVGIIGPNGAGKTTLFKMIVGEERPDAGKIAVGKREIASRAYVAMFNFKGADQQKRVGDLSGGEMNRLHLARTLKRGGNVLLSDEPTNDLDVDTLRALEEARV